MSFHENLKRIRTDAQISRQDIATALNMHANAYGMYETGAREPNLEKLRTIAEFLHVSIDDLLDYRPDELQYWIKKWNQTVPGISIKKAGEKIVITQSRFPYLKPAVFCSESDFIGFSQLAEHQAAKKYKMILFREMHALLVDKLLDNYNELEKMAEKKEG